MVTYTSQIYQCGLLSLWHFSKGNGGEGFSTLHKPQQPNTTPSTLQQKWPSSVTESNNSSVTKSSQVRSYYRIETQGLSEEDWATLLSTNPKPLTHPPSCHLNGRNPAWFFYQTLKGLQFFSSSPIQANASGI